MDQALASLVKGCKKGEQWAQERLYARYYGEFMPVCERYLGPRGQSEEALNDAFLKIFDKIDTYRGKGSFEGWMKRILINHCLDLLRKNERKLDTNDDLDGLERLRADTPADEQNEFLKWLLNQLPDQHKKVFNLYVIDGFKHKEIAKMLGMTQANSKYCLHQARKALKELYQKKEVYERSRVR